MAKLYHDAGGVPLAFRRTDAEDALLAAPAGASGSVSFDERANAVLAQQIADQPPAYRVVAGVIQKDGVPAVVQPDAPDTAQLRGRFVGGVRVSADRSTSTTAYVDVPDLQFQLEPNSHYAFQFDGAYTAAAATTGLQLAVDGPASPAFLGVGFEIATAVSTWLAAFSGSYNSGADGTASGGAVLLPFHVYGTISTGAAGGLLKLRGKSEVNGSAVTIKRGSYGLLFKVG